MRPYIYLQAVQKGEDVAFRYVEVKADNDEDAYAVGGRTMVDHAHAVLNDFVIPLAPALRVIRNAIR